MGLPTVLWGLSGIAKSAIIKQTAQKIGLPLEIVYPGTHAPEDFSSLPVVIDNKLMSACMLSQVTALNQLGGGLLFLDEIQGAPPAVQGAMLSMILERQVGAIKFDPRIRILLAANPPEYSAGGWGLEAPFSNRMAHFYVKKPPAARITAWILSEGSHRPQTLEQPLVRLQENWGDVWSKVKGAWAGIINARDSIRHMQPKPDHPQAGYCWPSDRTWEFAFRAVATCRALGFDDALEALFMEACVGEGATSEYLAWAHNANLPDPMTVLQNGWAIPRQLDRVHAVYSSITTLVIDQREGPEKWRLAALGWRRFSELMDAGHSDIAGLHAQAFISDGLYTRDSRCPDEVKRIAEPVILKIGRIKGLIGQFKLAP